MRGVRAVQIIYTSQRDMALAGLLVTFFLEMMNDRTILRHYSSKNAIKQLSSCSTGHILIHANSSSPSPTLLQGSFMTIPFLCLGFIDALCKNSLSFIWSLSDWRFPYISSWPCWVSSMSRETPEGFSRVEVLPFLSRRPTMRLSRHERVSVEFKIESLMFCLGCERATTERG